MAMLVEGSAFEVPPVSVEPATAERRLHVECRGKTFDWVSVREVTEMICGGNDFVATLRDNIAHYFQVPVEYQAVFDDRGLLSSSMDFIRSLQRVSPCLCVHDAREMPAKLRDRTVRDIMSANSELAKTLKMLRDQDVTFTDFSAEGRSRPSTPRQNGTPRGSPGHGMAPFGTPNGLSNGLIDLCASLGGGTPPAPVFGFGVSSPRNGIPQVGTPPPPLPWGSPMAPAQQWQRPVSPPPQAPALAMPFTVPPFRHPQMTPQQPWLTAPPQHPFMPPVGSLSPAIRPRDIPFMPPVGSQSPAPASREVSLGAPAEEVRSEPSNRYISLTKTATGHKFGFANIAAEDGAGLLITWVDPSGMLHEWNMQHPGEKAESGDCVVGVNGIVNNLERMRRELENSSVELEVRPKRETQPFKY